jgi:hypothetical protein
VSAPTTPACTSSEEPFGDFHADAGLTGLEGLVIRLPQLAPSGVEEHAVAGLKGETLHALIFQRALDVGQGHDVTGLQHLDALEGRDVEQDAARHDRVELFDTEFLQAGLAEDIRFRKAIVVAHVACVGDAVRRNADMAEPVELGADLADLRGDDFVLVDDGIGAGRAAAARARALQIEGPATERGDRAVVFAAQLVDLARVDLGQSPQYDLGPGVPVGRPGFVALAPQGVRPPALADRSFGRADHPGFSLAVLPGLRAAFGVSLAGQAQAKRDRAEHRECSICTHSLFLLVAWIDRHCPNSAINRGDRHPG